MDMSRAALPPRQPHISELAKADPLFPKYRELYHSCIRLMIEAPRFEDYKLQHKREAKSDLAVKDYQYPDFLAWCRATQSGRRHCPFGDFPENFEAWKTGKHW